MYRWTEHRSNQEVSDMVDENRSLMNTIRQRQKNWFGHVLKSESLLRTVLEGRMGQELVGDRVLR